MVAHVCTAVDARTPVLRKRNAIALPDAPATAKTGAGSNRPNEGPALLDFLAAAIRTEDLSLFVIDEGQDFGEVSYNCGRRNRSGAYDLLGGSS
jgi:hypothetical protein